MTEKAIAKKEVAEKKTVEKEITSEKLQQLVEKDKTSRMQSCQSEIEVILQKYGCQLIALPGINIEGRVIAEVQIKIAS